MLQPRIQKQIPQRLSHYTNLEALKSILSDRDGKGICLWAFSNKYKNDDQEIKMGEYMLKRVISTLPKTPLLHNFGDYENTASISFTEGEVNQHMLDEYGHIRLEFDLKEIGVGIVSGGLVDCEYVAESQLKDYADEYCEMIRNTFYSIPTLQEKYGKKSAPPISQLIDFLMMELDIMGKVFCLKEKKWSAEKEWRKVIKLNPNDANTHYFHKKPYVEYYLDKTTLTGIKVYCSLDTLDIAQENANTIINYISERGYNAKVLIERLDEL